MEEPTGEKLLDFTEIELNHLLVTEICKPCDDANDCHGCPGIEILGEMESQIKEEGIKYMRELLSTWKKQGP